MTEEEAFKKWCPQRPRDAHHIEDVTRVCRCVASACMAWRTYTYYPAGIDMLKADPFKDKITGGYCGLAGKP